jgi:pyruvate-formate lyase
MVIKSDTDEALLKKIDGLQLSERLFQLKDAMFSAPRIISVERARLAMESWKETEGEDIELRRARLFRKVLEGAPIAIHDFDIIIGRETEHLIGAPVFVDETGDCIPGLWDEGDSLSRAMVFQAKDDKNVLRECSRFFAGKTAPDHGGRLGKGYKRCQRSRPYP